MKTLVSFVLITMVNFAMVGILLKNFAIMCYNIGRNDDKG